MKFSFFALSVITLVSTANAQDTYTPARAEQHVIDIKNHDSSSGCLIWNEDSPLRNDLELWKNELRQYTDVINEKLQTDFAPDLRRLFNDDYNNKEQVCRAYADPSAHVPIVNTVAENRPELKLYLRGRNLQKNPNGPPALMEEYFNGSKQLSYLPRQGYMEPLVPPLRHPDMCLPNNTRGDYVATMDYMIEDFGHICRNVLNRNMRTVFIDMGACYKFEHTINKNAVEAIKAIEKYRHNGIHFDHIYAYEVRELKTEDVYASIPDHMKGPLHWINMPVSPEEGHDDNPWTMLKKNFRPDDFIVVKLDIDTPSVEMPLFQQLLASPELQELVDVFYFEHHVEMDEMQTFWGAHGSGLTKGSITESLEMFQNLRKAGVAAHYWI